jgi:hypothetical protein
MNDPLPPSPTHESDRLRLQIWLFMLFGKDDASDLTAAYKRQWGAEYNGSK